MLRKATDISRSKKIRLKKNISLSPKILKPNFDNIPASLKKFSIWAVWKGETRKNGKLAKPPTDPRTGQMARVNDPRTFSSFAEAQKAYETGKYDGIGILVNKMDNISLLGVDIDDCLSEGQLSNEAETIINSLRTYTEKSPSGKGVHCIGATKSPFTLEGCRRGKVELYIGNHFLTVTGHKVNDNQQFPAKF